MTKEELIKYFKNLTEITKKDNTKDLEVGVEISVEMAERLIDIIEKQQEEIENSVSKDKIRALEKEYSIRCAVLSRSATPDQWYSMGRNIGRTLTYQELLEVE